MNVEIGNSLSGYVITLYKLNQKLIKLCGINVIDKYEYSHNEILNIIQDIPRLIPYEYNRNKKVLELTDKNGLLEYKNRISYLEEKYTEILRENYSFLDNIRKIRNKYEHKMHDIKRKSSGSGSVTFFDFEFEVSGERIILESDDFIKLIKKLNLLFSLIVKDIRKFARENKEDNHPYYRRLNRFDFEDFNKIYDSELLRYVGKLMLDF